MKKEKAPFKVLFSNDTTNIETCVSPYHKKDEWFRPEMLEATVDETAGTGVEVHMLQPGLGWVPWWKSKIYPGKEHYQWLKKRYNMEDGFGQYMLNGGDMVEVFVRRCRQHQLVPFVSFRLNDGHGKECISAKETPPYGLGECLDRFYEQHPEYRIGSDINDWNQRVHNWAIPEVREYKFAFIRELCENYDIDGFELDFMRHSSFFQLDKTTSKQRTQIMTGFVTRVREVLDKSAKPGQHRWLCVRVPCYLAAHDRLGIDLPAMVTAGVEMVNLSAHFFTEQQTDFPGIRKMIPEVAVYLEMTHCTSSGPAVVKGYDSCTYRRTTDQQFYTTANLVYARGGDGVSLFNFVYYREHGTPGRGPFNEPPFHVFKHLADPLWLSRQPQHYMLGNVWNAPRVPNRPIPRKFLQDQTVTFTLDMAPPEGGWKSDGKLRIQGKESLKDSQWRASFNGDGLKLTTDVSEPYPNPYPPLLGTPDQYRAWTVPVRLLKDGRNSIEITLIEGDPAEISWLDLAVQ